MYARLLVVVAVVWVGGAGSVGSAGAFPPVLTRVVGTGTPSPDGGTFTSVGGAAIDNGMVSFIGSTSRSNRGIFTWSPSTGFGTVADFHTPAPGTPNHFTDFASRTVISNGNVAFLGTSFTVSGLYVRQDGVIHRVADTNMLIPGTNTRFEVLSSPAYNGTHVAFSGDAFQQHAIYRYTPTTGLEVVVDQSTPVPGRSGGFGSFQASSPSFDGDSMSFSPTSGPDGIYTWDAGVVRLIADQNTPVPGGNGNFTSMGGVSYDAGTVSFFGVGMEGAMFLATGNTIFAAVDTHTPIPGGQGNFTSLGSGSLDNGRLVFGGVGSNNQSGIYMWENGVITKILARNDQLGGRTVASLSTNDDTAISGSQIILAVLFSDGTSAHYIATVPEPASIMLIGFAMVVCVNRGRRYSRIRRS